MLPDDLLAIGLYFGFFIATGLPAVLLKFFFNVPFEVVRKLYHMVITLTIFPLVMAFEHWYAAVLTVLLFALILYPLLVAIEKTTFYRRIAVERKDGEFKRSLLIVQLSMALMLFLFWGLLGAEWKYVAVVAVLAWGLGDAAAALVGKKFGRRRIRHARIQGAKTVEGTQAMYVTAGLAIFFTFLFYVGQPWHISLAAALLVAPVCALVELFSNRGMDTITVPISAGVAVLILMSFLSLIGV